MARPLDTMACFTWQQPYLAGEEWILAPSASPIRQNCSISLKYNILEDTVGGSEYPGLRAVHYTTCLSGPPKPQAWAPREPLLGSICLTYTSNS